MEIKTVKDYNELISIAEENSAVCFYLSTPRCNICRVLKPKVIELLKENFPRIHFYYVDLNEAKEISGLLSVFSIPTILVYFEGREMIRTSRNLHLSELYEQIDRYYKMIF